MCQTDAKSRMSVVSARKEELKSHIYRASAIAMMIVMTTNVKRDTPQGIGWSEIQPFTAILKDFNLKVFSSSFSA